MGGHESVVKLLLAYGVDNHLSTITSKRWPLNLAGHSSIVQLFARRGTRISPPGHNEADTTLH